MLSPLVSIILPAYNAAPYIRACIDSLLGQTYPHFELLIADDGSTDGTREILDTYTAPRIRRFDNPHNIGKIPTFNFLLTQARGELIGQQDADDVSDPGRLQRQVEYLMAHPEVDVLGTHAYYINRKGEVLGHHDTLPLEHEQIRAILPHWRGICPSVVLRRKVYDQIGGYAENIAKVYCRAADVYWMARMITRGFRFANLPDSLYLYRLSEGSIVRNHRLQFAARAKFYMMEVIKDMVCDLMKGVDDPAANLIYIQTLAEGYDLPYRQDPSLFYQQVAYSSLEQRDIPFFLRNLYQGLRINARGTSRYLYKQLSARLLGV